MAEKFGKVYISEKTCDNDTCIELESASFSNLSLKWYNPTGDIHSNFVTYQHHYFSFGVDIENLTKYGTRENYSAKLLMPIKLEEFGNGPTLEYLENFGKMERDLAENLDLLDPDDTEQVVLFSNSQSILGFVLPEEKLAEKSTILLYLSMAVIMDDLLDSDGGNEDSGFSNALREISYSKIIKQLSPGILSLQGHPLSQSVDTSSVFLSEQNLGLHDALTLQRYCSAYLCMSQCLREEAMKLVEGDESKALPFLTTAQQMFEAVALDISQEWNAEIKNDILDNAQVELRKLTNGIPVSVEAAALQMGIYLKPEIRDSFLLKWWLGEVAYHSGKINDLLSYNVEMKTGNVNTNEVYKLHKEQGLELGEALRKVENDANACVKRIIKGAELLQKIFEEDKELKRYIQVAKLTMVGLIQSNCYVKRWHPNITWDCYVEPQIELM